MSPMQNRDRMTLAQYLIEQQRKHPLMPNDLHLLIEGVAHACQMISARVSQGALGGILGSAEYQNVHGETQKKLDLIANDILLEANQCGGYLAAMASEELEAIYHLPPSYPTGNYLLLFDPLDGSSNVDVNVSIGTIFSVLRCIGGREKGAEGVGAVSEQSFLQPGSQQIAAGYALYGPQTVLVLTMGHGVSSFTLDRERGSWILTQDKMRIPDQTCEFAINASNARYWYPPVKRYIDELIAGKDGLRQQDFNMRWIGSMVADIHRLLNRGGIFMYPADQRQPTQPGKLRLLYEANPMAYIIEQAGGAAINGTKRMLDIIPRQLHERVAVFIGSKNEVERVSRYHLA